MPTPEHYLPLLYAIALQQAGETAEFFNVRVPGSISMSSVLIGAPRRKRQEGYDEQEIPGRLARVFVLYMAGGIVVHGVLLSDDYLATGLMRPRPRRSR